MPDTADLCLAVSPVSTVDEATRAASVGLYRLSLFHVKSAAQRGFLSGYGSVDVRRIEAAMTSLAQKTPYGCRFGRCARERADVACQAIRACRERVYPCKQASKCVAQSAPRNKFALTTQKSHAKRLHACRIRR
jgi:hypothetical protein